MSYRIQELNFQFELVNNDDFFENGEKICSVNSPKSTAQIKTITGLSSGRASFKVWGLSRETIAVLMRMGIWGAGKEKKFNKIRVTANNIVCYEGIIVNSYADFNQAPDIALNIDCYPCAFLMTEVAMPFSFNGEVKASDIIESIIKPFNMTLDNNGVVDKLTNPYIEGSPHQQIYKVAEQVKASIVINYGGVYLSKRNKQRHGETFIVSPETGLIGFPSYYNDCLCVKTYFNGDYLVGGLVKLETYLPLASGEYLIQAVEHNLSCNLPGGLFESSLLLTPKRT